MKHIKSFEKYNESMIVTAAFGLIAALGLIVKLSDYIYTSKSEGDYNKSWKIFETGEEEDVKLSDGTVLKIKKIKKDNQNYYSIIDKDLSGYKKIFVLNEERYNKLKKDLNIKTLSGMADAEYFKADLWNLGGKSNRRTNIPSF